MRQALVYIMLMLCVSVDALAQGEIDTQDKIFYRNEWTVGLQLSSFGFGAGYRYGFRQTVARKSLWEIDFMYIKHPKEKKTYSLFVDSDAKYVLGKQNAAFGLRGGYGNQRELFRKHDYGGISIRMLYTFGPSIGILKPAYYYVGDPQVIQTSNGTQTVVSQRPESEKYNPEWENTNVYIIRRASFFKGFSGLKLIPGAYAKFGFNFEFSKNDRIVNCLEAGLTFDAFLKPLDILDFSNAPMGQAVAKNQQFILGCYVAYRFGRIVDPYAIKKQRRSTEANSF